MVLIAGGLIIGYSRISLSRSLGAPQDVFLRLMPSQGALHLEG